MLVRFAHAVSATTGTPMPTPTITVDPDSVSPGFIGFAVVLIVVIAVILLIWDMNRRVRRVRYREEVRAELDAEQAAAGSGGHSSVPEGGAPAEPGDAQPPRR